MYIFCYCVNIPVITFNTADPTDDIDASALDDVDAADAAADVIACTPDPICILLW